MPSLFAKERILAQPGYNRWLVPPASIAIHLCIGSVYAWSNFNAPLTRVRGVLASAPGDWTLRDTMDASAPLYNTTMFLMAALLTVALVANSLIRPVHTRHHVNE